MQPDNIVPDPFNPQDLDRYSYVRNNPVNFNDPSGHCIDIIECFLAALGLAPDIEGVWRASSVMNYKTDNIEVAAGIAVQSEFLAPWDLIIIPGASSGYGIAQTNSDEINTLGLGNLDPLNDSDAVKVMSVRIEKAQNACTECGPKDLLIVAALAQNRGITPGDVAELVYQAKGSNINWEPFFNQQNTPGQIDANIRQGITGIPYKTKFMILKYALDLKGLHAMGWELPKGVTEEMVDELINDARRVEIKIKNFNASTIT